MLDGLGLLGSWGADGTVCGRGGVSGSSLAGSSWLLALGLLGSCPRFTFDGGTSWSPRHLRASRMTSTLSAESCDSTRAESGTGAHELRGDPVRGDKLSASP